MSELQKKQALVSHCAIPGCTQKICSPRFAGDPPACLKNVDKLTVELPAIDIVELGTKKVIGGTSFALSENLIIHPDLFLPSRDLTPAENFGVAKRLRDNAGLQFYLNREIFRVDNAVSLLGQSTGNFAHWLTETLPKLLVIDSVKGYEALPLLLDRQFHPVFKETVDFFNIHNREIIWVNRWEPVNVERLVDVSPAGYEPYAPHGVSHTLISKYINVFSPTALKLLRDMARKKIDVKEASKLVYLKRSKKSGNLRRVKNLSSVERELADRGFKSFRPGSMCFKDQICSVYKARAIVAPVGAALANMIFAPEGCMVIVLAARFDEGNYYYYSNLAQLLGHDLYYVLGEPSSTGIHPLHMDYQTDLKQLTTALNKVSLGTKIVSTSFA